MSVSNPVPCTIICLDLDEVRGLLLAVTSLNDQDVCRMTNLDPISLEIVRVKLSAHISMLELMEPMQRFPG